jgi:hypothetical protein
MWANMDGSEMPSFKPDYKKTVAEVYGDLVRYFIALPKNLDVGEGSLRIMLRNESLGKMQVGDVVCVLFGEVLFILRPVGGAYRLIGECYVHGFMQSEAMVKLTSGEMKDQWFDLQ